MSRFIQRGKLIQYKDSFPQFKNNLAFWNKRLKDILPAVPPPDLPLYLPCMGRKLVKSKGTSRQSERKAECPLKRARVIAGLKPGYFRQDGEREIHCPIVLPVILQRFNLMGKHVV